MNKHLKRALPITCGVLLFSSQQLSAFGNYALGDSIAVTKTSAFEEALAKQKQSMYVLQDADIYQDTTNVSSIVTSVTKGEEVLVMGVEGDLCEVLTSEGKTGYVLMSRLTDSLVNIYQDEDKTMYAVGEIAVRQSASDNSTTVLTLSQGDEVHVIGSNDYSYLKVEINGETYYVHSNDVTDTYFVVAEETTYVDANGQTVTTVTADSTYSPATVTWTGSVLTPSMGVNWGPSGKETYYNLNMSYCVQIMHSLGFVGEYWVRSDGVKMFGDYVMVAADYSIRPRGTILETSLGMAIVVDTGTFIYSNPTQVDIAVAW